MLIQYIIFTCMFLAQFIHSANTTIHIDRQSDSITLTTLYGTTEIHEPALIALIESPQFERLKYINQYGALSYRPDEPSYSRYTHSLGVFFLTRLYGGSLEEQVKALLHDVSHTAFSHVADSLFASNHKQGGGAYQDDIFEAYLDATGLTQLLESFGLRAACSSAMSRHWKRLKQPSPDICTDRLEYNLMGCYIDGLTTASEVADILNHLIFADNGWSFTDIRCAQTFANLSLTLCEQRWGAAWNAYVDLCAARALQRALDIHCIELNDIHYGTDDALWNILTSSPDAIIQEHLRGVFLDKADIAHEVIKPEFSHLVGKFSGIDPYVMIDGIRKRLTEWDQTYHAAFYQSKDAVNRVSQMASVEMAFAGSKQ